MRSALPKVLHPIASEPMLTHVLRAASAEGDLAVVVGPSHDAVAEVVHQSRPGAGIYVQTERLGTAHAVLAARAALAQDADDVVVAFGDTPLITGDTFARLRAALAGGAALAVLGFRAADPTGYGRLIVADGRLQAIREHADATAAERAIDLCNAGVMAFAGRDALAVLERIGNVNCKGEYYLTDAVAIVGAMGREAVVVEAPEDEVRGINTKAQLAEAERAMQDRLRAAALDAGVTLVAPETVFFAADTTFGRDVVVEPYVVFGRKVSVGDGAVIHAFSHLVEARVGAGASIGPYARLRPGTVLGEGARIGNFVETKAATIEAGAKVNHLTYIGDAHIGPKANIGAGTITCNYDGFDKYRTEIGAGAFVGSNSSLVAPVSVGAGAYIGSGSVVTEDIPEDALRVERNSQATRPGWARRFRERKEAERASRPKKA
jgi:bifunctional UDP-N-acetylglucosamine pyrophosphorylase/glucosamine-1-phosphate N-acetyltransferase